MTKRKRGYDAIKAFEREGLERARRHIAEARELSEKLGGTDKDVKAYFFSLSGSRLAQILDAYEGKYGLPARLYAEETFSKWRSGKVHMSGLVAGRLFDLLPDYMPVEEKFGLVKSLWEKQCPQTRKELRLGPDADEKQVISAIRDHFERVVVEYGISESIKRRFQWLGREEVQLQEKLYNYFLQLNRDAIADAVEKRIPNILAEVRRLGASAASIKQTVIVANHRVKIVFDPYFSGFEWLSSSLAKRTGGESLNEKGTGCLLCGAIAGLLSLGITLQAIAIVCLVSGR